MRPRPLARPFSGCLLVANLVVALCSVGLMGKWILNISPSWSDAVPSSEESRKLPSVCGRWLDSNVWEHCPDQALLGSSLSSPWGLFATLALKRLKAEAARSRTKVRLLFVGDSQTRYLYAAVAEQLADCCSTDGLVPSGLLPPNPTTRFAFAWVSHMWPHAALNSSIRLGFVSTEYFSGGAAETRLAIDFDPTHVVVGRGCWDMVRRIPHSHATTFFEFSQGLARWRAAFNASVLLVVYVFPHVGVPPSHDSNAVDESATRAQLTKCVFTHLQESYRAALHDAVTAVNSKILYLTNGERTGAGRNSIAAFDVFKMTKDAPRIPVDGVHYDGVVGLEIAKALGHRLHQAEADAARRQPEKDGDAQLDWEVTGWASDSPGFMHERCAEIGLPYYNYVVEHVISKELDALGRLLDATHDEIQPLLLGFSRKVPPQRPVLQENLDSALSAAAKSFSACAHIIGLASRHFGPSALWRSQHSMLLPRGRRGGIRSWLRRDLHDVVEELLHRQKQCDEVVDVAILNAIDRRGAGHVLDRMEWIASSSSFSWINRRMVTLRLWGIRDSSTHRRRNNTTWDDEMGRLLSFGQIPLSLNMPFGRLP